MDSSREPARCTVRRRDVLCAGGAAAFSALTASLLGGIKPAVSEVFTPPVAEVDRVAVRVVVDSYQVAVIPAKKLDDVDIQHFGWGLSENRPPGRTLISEFGLAMHAEAQRGDQVRQVLIDFGFTPEALSNNTQLLGIDPAKLDALVLSHGHYDHFGGLAGFLKRNQKSLKPRLPLYIGGEEAYCSRHWTAGAVPGDFGALDRPALRNANLAITSSERPVIVADLGFTTGQIDLNSFEKLLPPSSMKIGMTNGVGCDSAAFSPEEQRLGAFPDKFRHEIATAFNLKGRGLVVLSSCSHRGIVNAVKRAQAASGVQKVHAVIGGFHLIPYKEDYVSQSVAALKDMNVDYVVPLHCSGEPFYAAANREMPGKVLRVFTGTRLVFT